MNIKGKLYASAGISIFLSVILFSLVLVMSDKMTRENRRHGLLNSVKKSISELDIVTYEYLLHHEKRMRQQWNLKFHSLGKILAEAPEDVMMESIRFDYAAFGDLFSGVVANNEKIQKLVQEKASREKIDIAIALDKRLAAQLLIKSHSIITDASRLAEDARAEVKNIQGLVKNLTITLTVILTTTVTTLALLIARNISKPLKELTKGVKTVGLGDLKHKVKIRRKDELGQLAAGFNKMTENLTRITDELNKEIAYRKRAEKKIKKYSEDLEKMVDERTKELRDTQEQLVRREKLVFLGQMAAGIAHEIRNPLGAIKSAAYLLNMTIKEKNEPDIKEAMNIIDREVDASEKIITDLLDFTRAKPPDFAESDANLLVEEALYQCSFPENIKVRTKSGKSPIHLFCDSKKIVLVFRNIIQNAVQAMPDGGLLEIKLRADNAEQIAVSFSDTGEGIRKGDMKKLFEPLFTTRARGIGLGLSISKIYIEAHEGSIEVESEKGKGCVFTVVLPLHQEKGKST